MAIFLLRITGSKQSDGSYRYECMCHPIAQSAQRTRVFENELEMLDIMDKLLAKQPEPHRGNIRNVLDLIRRPEGYMWEYPLEATAELARALGCD